MFCFANCPGKIPKIYILIFYPEILLNFQQNASEIVKFLKYARKFFSERKWEFFLKKKPGFLQNR